MPENSANSSDPKSGSQAGSPGSHAESPGSHAESHAGSEPAVSDTARSPAPALSSAEPQTASLTSGGATATNSESQTPRQAETLPTATVSDTQSLLENLAKLLASAPANPRLTPKPMEEYKFWKTQPVMKFDADADAPAKPQPIEQKQVADVPTNPKRLPEGFEWSVLDVTNDAQLEELYQLLYANYIEDDDEQFRFRYSVPFLKWALQTPGYVEEWAVGVRASKTGKLLAFISGVPATIKIRGQSSPMCEINFMCVHKQLRGKRLAPVLIAEVTRRVNLRNIWHALYTGGNILPAPVSTCRYFHRTLDWPKLYDVGFSYLPPNSTPAQQVAKYQLPAEPSLAGFRRMTEKDIPEVHKLLEAYLSRFELVQEFTDDELKHWLFADPSIVHAFVVEKDNKIVDFTSFYGLESTVLGNDKHSSISVAYSFYYATDAPVGSPELKQRLADLFQASLIEAKKLKFDVFNALTLLDNPLFLEDLKFGGGDGLLHYYLFNYKMKPVDGGVDKQGTITKPGGVGVIML